MLTWSLDRKQNARTSHIFMSPPNCTNISLYFKVMNCSILVKQDLPRSLKPIFSLRTSDWIQVRLVLGAWRCNLLWLLYVVFVFGVYLYMIYVRFQIYIYIYISLCVYKWHTLFAWKGKWRDHILFYGARSVYKELLKIGKINT